MFEVACTCTRKCALFRVANFIYLTEIWEINCSEWGLCFVESNYWVANSGTMITEKDHWDDFHVPKEKDYGLSAEDSVCV